MVYSTREASSRKTEASCAQNTQTSASIAEDRPKRSLRKCSNAGDFGDGVAILGLQVNVNVFGRPKLTSFSHGLWENLIDVRCSVSQLNATVGQVISENGPRDQRETIDAPSEIGPAGEKLNEVLHILLTRQAEA